MLYAPSAGRWRQNSIVALILPRSVKRLLESAARNIPRLNMTAPPKMRDLANRLLTYEVVDGKTSESVESVTLRVYEKLRQVLGGFAGVAGFQSLASRALALARTEAPSLDAVRVSADGALLGLGETGHQIDIDKDRTGESRAGEGGIILIARLLGLLHLFLGEALTFSLLRVTWPDAAFDIRNSENGRKA
jgi:hypothetical protein